MKSETIPIHSRMTIPESIKVDEEIRKGNAISRSDFLRQAIREKLARTEA